jgi:hypothetical protein
MNSLAPTPSETESIRPRRQSFMATLMLHALILLGVVILPVVVYNVVSASSLRRIQGLEFSGGATYVLYAVYWIAKIPSFRIKFILLHLATLLVVALTTANFSTRSTPAIAAVLPTIVGVLPGLGICSSWFRRINGIAATCCISILLALPLGAILSFLILYGSAMSSIGGMRY